MTKKPAKSNKRCIVFSTRSVIIKRFMCNHIDVNEPVLELVRIENSAFNKNFKAIK